MRLIVYDSEYDNESQFIHNMQSLMNEMLICVYKDKKLYTVRQNFSEIYNRLLLKEKHIVVTKKGNDVMINDFTIKRTTKLGKEILMAWYTGHVNEQNVFNAFNIDSPLVESLYQQ